MKTLTSFNKLSVLGINLSQVTESLIKNNTQLISDYVDQDSDLQKMFAEPQNTYYLMEGIREAVAKDVLGTDYVPEWFHEVFDQAVLAWYKI